MSGLLFPFGELVEEAVALGSMAKQFLVARGPRVLNGLKRDLQRIGGRSTDRVQELVLHPLRTKPTRDYEPMSRSGGQKIYALISGKWELRSVGRKGPKRKIAFVGKASTVFELWPENCIWRESHDRSNRLAMWRIELGADDAPGCYFHTQILGDRDQAPFPKALPIPRLPSPFVTPMAAVEFALGELFQDKWQKEARRARDAQRRWRSIQRRRWSNLLMWQNDLVTRRTSSPWVESIPSEPSSPWIDLKHAQPPNNLFCPS